jgi:hypothetical protein
VRVLKAFAKLGAWGSGWTSAILCLSAASGFWIDGQHKKSICWAVLALVEIVAIVW